MTGRARLKVVQGDPLTQRRAGLYIRVSATMGRTGDDFLSPTTQLDRMTAAAEREGDRIVQVWEDIDRTGRTMDNRDGLAAAVQAARDGVIDRLWFYDVSRLARNAAEGLRELAEIEKHGVMIGSATESVDRTTAAGRLTFGMLLLMAEHQSDIIADRWKDNIATNARRGVHHGRAPTGYLRGGRRELLVDPVAGPMMAEMFRRFAEGEALSAVTMWVSEARGVQTVRHQVTRALGSPVYRGMVTLKGITYQGRHDPLVDEATWLAVQDRLASARAVPSRSKQGAHSMAGLLWCGRCGGAATRKPRYRKGREPASARYGSDDQDRAGVVCVTAESFKSKCRGIGCPALVPIEAEVLRLLMEHVAGMRDETAAGVVVEESRRDRAKADGRSVADEIARAEKSLGVLAVKLAEGVLSDVAYRGASVTLEASLERLRGQAREVRRVVSAPDPVEAASMGEKLLLLWPDMSPQERNAGLHTHILRVRVLPMPSVGYKRPRPVEIDWL